MAESYALGLLLFALLGVTAISLATAPIWQPGARPAHTGACPARRPSSTLDLPSSLASSAIPWGNRQSANMEIPRPATRARKPPTGVAIYRWCTNTPSFTRGQEHWLLTPTGLEYWTDAGPPPAPQTVLRAVDLRQPCDL